LVYYCISVIINSGESVGMYDMAYAICCRELSKRLCKVYYSVDIW